MSKSRGESWLISYGIYIVILGGVGRGSCEDFEIFFWNGPKRTLKWISIPNLIKIGQRESVQIEGRKWLISYGKLVWELFGGVGKGVPMRIFKFFFETAQKEPQNELAYQISSKSVNGKVSKSRGEKLLMKMMKMNVFLRPFWWFSKCHNFFSIWNFFIP